MERADPCIGFCEWHAKHLPAELPLEGRFLAFEIRIVRWEGRQGSFDNPPILKLEPSLQLSFRPREPHSGHQRCAVYGVESLLAKECVVSTHQAACLRCHLSNRPIGNLQHLCTRQVRDASVGAGNKKSVAKFVNAEWVPKAESGTNGLQKRMPISDQRDELHRSDHPFVLGQ